MTFDISGSLKFYPDYFLKEITPEVEPVNAQLARLFPNLNLIDKINDLFEPTIEEFRRNYLNKNLRDANGNTILHRLILFDRHLKYFKEIVKNDKNAINATNDTGDTPYHIAAGIKSTKYLSELRLQNARTDILNKNGITVKQLLERL